MNNVVVYHSSNWSWILLPNAGIDILSRKPRRKKNGTSTINYFFCPLNDANFQNHKEFIFKLPIMCSSAVEGYGWSMQSQNKLSFIPPPLFPLFEIMTLLHCQLTPCWSNFDYLVCILSNTLHFPTSSLLLMMT